MKKAFIDSNIIIRLFAKDHEQQFFHAQKIIRDIEQDAVQGLISILVVNEILWILENFYDLKRATFVPWLLQLISLRNIKIIEIKKDLLITILKHMEKQKIDFTDLYLFYTAGKTPIMSFDKDFQKITT